MITKPFLGLLVVFPLLISAAEQDTTAQGRVLLGELNCVACHSANTESIGITPKAGPRLAGLGRRASAAWVRQFLTAPHETLPGTTMPDLLHGVPADERDAAAEQLTHFLLADSAAEFRRIRPDRAAVARGEALYHRVGCVACHSPQDGKALAGSPLPSMADKWSLDGLRQFLRDPLATRPAGRMPAMGLSEREAADLAQYLLRETRVPAPLDVELRRGGMRSFDDIPTADLLRSTATTGFTLDDTGAQPGTAMQFRGFVHIEQAGSYTFHLNGTGGARLSVRGTWLAGNETWDNQEVVLQATVELDTGWHAIVVEFIPRGQKQHALLVEWQGPGVARSVIPASRLRSEREPAAEPTPFVVDADKAERGRVRYQQLGCASCHDAQPPSFTAPALATLQRGRGCLAEQPTAGVPHYQLDAAQRSALTTAMTATTQAPTALTPAQRVAHTLSTFQCYACHVRDGRGGVSSHRSAYFTSNAEDAGDEGRLPPSLDGVGDRLRPSWLTKVLTQDARVRPYVNTRMPQYGAANVGHLPELLVAIDRQGQEPPPGPEPRDELREVGRKLTGTQGLSCIACHRFNRQPAHTMQMLDLTTAPERLNEDWFRSFLRDPNRFHPGTRMPSLWPGGQSLLPDVLNGNTDRQHAALWTYFSDGPGAKFPVGLSRMNMELVVGGEAVVYRGKMWEAGFRAIATGYPGAVNVAFDAEDMRLALLWRGRFLDASPHWSVSGMGKIRPLGSDVVVFPHGPALALLADATTPWPTASSRTLGLRFQGYQLDEQKRPTLLYAFQELSLTDRFDPLPDAAKPGLHRSLTVTGPAPVGMHLRLAVGSLTASGPQSWRLNQALTLRVGAGGAALLRGAGNEQELLLPIVLRDGQARIEIDYEW